MTMVLGLMADSSGLIRPNKLSFKFQRCKESSPENYNPIRLSPKRIPPRARIQYFLAEDYGYGYGYGTKHAAATSLGRNHHVLSSDDDSPKQPFLLTWTNEAFLALKSLFAFLVEQPSQLKYIEWPSFQSTLKTASLTLVLVALLIVALSSVDSALCYLLALLLRRTP